MQKAKKIIKGLVKALWLRLVFLKSLVIVLVGLSSKKLKKIKEENKMLKNQKGQGLVEYIMITGLIALLIVGAVAAYNGALGGLFAAVGGGLAGL